MSISDEFKNRMIELADEKELSRTDLASQIGIPYDIFSRAILYGMIPSPRTLIKIANYFDVSIEYLLSRTENELYNKSENPTSFLERIDELRESQNLTYYQLCNKLHYSKNTFSNWKKRKSIPTLEYLKDLSEFFGVTIDYLLGRTDDK